MAINEYGNVLGEEGPRNKAITGAGGCLEFGSRLANEAHDLLLRLSKRVEPVLIEEPERPAAEIVATPPAQPPDQQRAPLFKEMNDRLYMIERALHAMSNVVERIDL